MQQFYVSHPGEIIARELAEMGISVNRFIEETCIQPAFLEGKMALTTEQAVLIAAIMGSDTRTLPRFPGARYHLGGFIFRPEMF
ncbi:hypothetical protein [Salmonella enterica]|uniref:hypothetical protein n=1 Tax=Salmonella enterica TaxID=28901 RepID=UPI00112F0E65|nr:hypothetical protein [Salmonella enterica]